MSSIGTAKRVHVDDLEMYVEVRGSGPALLLVPGAGGDAGQFGELADLLAADRTVVTYDRRSNSRTSRPDAWAATTVEQQADDAAGVLLALGLAPATVFGNSTGALIALSAALRHPALVNQALVHEPTLMSVLADPDGAMASVQPVISAGMEQGGLAGGAEAFLRFAAGPGYDRLPSDAVSRILGNAEVLFQAEFGSFTSWAPDPSAITGSPVDISVLTAESTAPFFAEAARWIADRRGTEVVTAPGGHMGFLEDPEGFAAVVADLLH